MNYLITGATGLIGSMLLRHLITLDEDINIIAPVRNLSKAREIFDDGILSRVTLLECDILSEQFLQLPSADYVIHCAAPTSSKYFVEHPVETFDAIVTGTRNVLEYSKVKKVKKLVFLSSLEVYGVVVDDTQPLAENAQGYIDPLSPRSSYSMGKRAAETLCALYATQYQVPVSIARLTQTTGEGIAKDDNRVIAQFVRLAVEGKDIVLHTTGESSRPYLYVSDAISAILCILYNGEVGEAYNVANAQTYISIKDLAFLVRDTLNPSINVVVQLRNDMGYAPPTKHRLASGKLHALGWTPHCDMKEIITRLASYLKNTPNVL